jgi:hypothetical protein
MSAAAAYVAIFVIAGLNAFGVFLASLLGIYGDGSSGSMPLVLGVGWTWVGAFAVAGFCMASKGQAEAGIAFCAKALPYALLFLVGGSVVWLVIKNLLF